MRICHVTAHTNSGAGRAVSRLNSGLLEYSKINSLIFSSSYGADSELVVQPQLRVKYLQEVKRILVNRILDKKLTDKYNCFSINVTPSLICHKINHTMADIVNLHWIGWEYIKIEDLKLINAPLVWTLHDMWPFTGGCHYSNDCNQYADFCGTCPQLKNTKESDLSRHVLKRKNSAWQNLNITLVAPSDWIAECARNSRLFQNNSVRVINHGISTNIFKPINQEVARSILNLPLGKKLLLFGAIRSTSDPRKGYDSLKTALQILKQNSTFNDLEIVIFGTSETGVTNEMGFTVRQVGHLNDEYTLATLYSAADLMVVPSQQEAFGQTALEALACGTPVVAFETTGLKDIVIHKKCGYLAQAFDAIDLANGIIWTLENSDRYKFLSINARERVEAKFTVEQQVAQYLSLYEEVLAHR